MGIFVTSQSRAAFRGETTRGKKRSPTRFLGIVSQDFEFPDLSREVLMPPSIGSGRRPFITLEQKREFKASIPIIPTTGEIFYYVFGTETYQADQPSSGINSHTLMPDNIGVDRTSGATMLPTAGSPSTTANASILPTMSLGFVLTGSPDFQRVATGVTVDGASFTLNEARELSCTLDVMGRSVEDWDIASPTLFSQPAATGQRPYMFYDRSANVTLMGTYNYATNAITGGRTFARVRGFTCSIRNNLREHYFTGTGDTATLSGTTTVSNGSATVTGSSTAFDTELLAGNRVRFGTEQTTYTVSSIASATSLTLTRTYSGSLTSGNTTYQVYSEPQEPFTFTTGNPTFDMTIDLVPAGKLGGSPATQTGSDTDAIYDLLREGVRGDILIPFQRATNDRLDFVFDDCLIKSAPHGGAEDGNEKTVTCTVAPREFRVVVRDTTASYVGL